MNQTPPSDDAQADAKPSGTRKWILPTAVAIALLIGAGIGATITRAASPTASENQAQIDQAVTQQVGQRSAELDERESELESRQKTIDSTKANQDRLQDEIDRTRTELANREQALTPREAEAARSTIGGDGTYVPGVDINPGTYRATPPSSACYWERLTSTAGGDILDNNYGSGPQVVTILDSDGAFQTEGCGSWTRAN